MLRSFLYSSFLREGSANIFPGGAVVAQLTVNQRVAGSNPARGARTFNPAIGRVFFGFWVMRALLAAVLATATAWASGFYVAPVTL